MITITHGDSKDCPDVRAGRWDHCQGHLREKEPQSKHARLLERRTRAAERQADALEDIQRMLRALFGREGP